ncbi:mRNA splicing protein prp18 [Ascosphaera aggregata]|nr:mRNA splicing protein prp18 [Ascosphaera aggregata]
MDFAALMSKEISKAKSTSSSSDKKYVKRSEIEAERIRAYNEEQQRIEAQRAAQAEKKRRLEEEEAERIRERDEKRRRLAEESRRLREAEERERERQRRKRLGLPDLSEEEEKERQQKESQNAETEIGDEEAKDYDEEELLTKLREMNEPARLFGETHKGRIQRYKRLRAAKSKALAGAKSKTSKGPIPTTLELVPEKDMMVPEKAPKDPQARRYLYRQLASWFTLVLTEWEIAMSKRDEATKETRQGKLAYNAMVQSRENMRPLFKKFEREELEESILDSVVEIVRDAQERRYVDANDAYLRLSIGKAAWPIGVTMVGIHERSAREKLSEGGNGQAHIMSDEVTRKFLQSIKRCLSFAQVRWPPEDLGQLDTTISLMLYPTVLVLGITHDLTSSIYATTVSVAPKNLPSNFQREKLGEPPPIVFDSYFAKRGTSNICGIRGIPDFGPEMRLMSYQKHERNEELTLKPPAAKLPAPPRDRGYGPAPTGAPCPIAPFDPSKDIQSIVKLWHIVLPMYAVPEERLKDLLNRGNGAHFVIRTTERNHKTLVVGFIATYKDPSQSTNFIAALIVHPRYQRQGIGSKLLDHAAEHLRATTGKLRITVGSSSPRFFPGVPLDIPAHAYDFFVKKGFTPEKGPSARDYVISLHNYHAPISVMERAHRAKVTYHALAPEEADACLSLQHEIFGNSSVWTGAYERLIKENNHRQIMVAFDEKTKKQIGWALMTEPHAGGLIDDLALPPIVGAKTGLIACVGVHPVARERGVGLGLVAAAAEDMKKRSLKYAFIDCVTLVDWYEKVDAKVWREYRTLSSDSYISPSEHMVAEAR